MSVGTFHITLVVKCSSSLAGWNLLNWHFLKVWYLLMPYQARGIARSEKQFVGEHTKACLFVWPEPCSLLTACKGSQGPAVCGLPGSTDETSICLSLKRWSVNMTWSNNYYTFWQLCAYGYTSVCVCPAMCTCAFVLASCAIRVFLPGQLVGLCETTHFKRFAVV